MTDVGLLLESPRDHFGDHFGASVSKLSIYVDFAVLILVSLKNERKPMPKVVKKGALFGGSRHGSSVVNSCPNLLFRVFEQAPFLYNCWVNFGLRLGSPGDHFGGHFGAGVSKFSICVDVSVLFGVSLKRS